MGGIGNRFQQIGFLLTTTTDGGGTVVRTRLTSFRTSQTKFLLVIPAGPKLLLGYKSYELFITRLMRTIQEADRTAQVQIVPTAYSTPAPAPRS